MKLPLLPCLAFFAAAFVGATAATAAEKPNVLFISIDDLNDWVGEFYGNPQTITPKLDSFAKSGATLFQNAHCPGPICGPSRSALLSGFMPSTTGVYGNDQNFLESEWVQENATLPEYFSKNGYITISRGKISHAHGKGKNVDHGQWMFDVWEKRPKGSPMHPAKLTSREKGIIDGEKVREPMDVKGSDFAWGPTRGGKEETSDYKTARWAVEQLGKDWEKPFFMAIGISKPHLPFGVPQEYFDRFDLDEVKIPEHRMDDFEDILNARGKPRGAPSDDFEWVSQDEKLFKSSVRAYLAAASYADDCVGEVLDGLANSKYADNTIIVVWGDHGWHLGEKLRFRKASLWRESTRAPLLVKMPGDTERQDSQRPVNLIDLYPTLIELCGLPTKELDGRSFAPLLKDPAAPWPYPTVTVTGGKDAAAMDERWHYIRHNDGSEELYDIEKDPMCFTNLALTDDPELVAVKKRLAAAMPTEFAPKMPKSNDDSPEVAKALEGRDLSQLK